MNEFYLLDFLYPKNRIIKSELRRAMTNGPSKELWSIYRKNTHEIERFKKSLSDEGVDVITIKDALYPSKLQEHPYAPFCITYRGDIEILKNDGLAIVGSREMDPNLGHWIHSQIPKISNNLNIISGAARGVDQAVHKEAIKCNKKCVLVLPSGLLNPYPKGFVDSVANYKNVLILSQFHPNSRIFKGNFYPRNFLIAGLSETTIVLQGRRQSGTMVTAQYSIDFHNDVYTLTASPWDERYSGNISLLNSGAGQITDLDLFQ